MPVPMSYRTRPASESLSSLVRYSTIEMTMELYSPDLSPSVTPLDESDQRRLQELQAMLDERTPEQTAAEDALFGVTSAAHLLETERLLRDSASGRPR